MKAKEPLIFGLIGYPIKHSLSPAMHNAVFKKLKLDAQYMLFEKSKEDFAHALTQLKLMKVGGFNVTVPYKEAVIPFLDEIDKPARQIGAVNTVVYRKGKFLGYNTDAAGFIISLKNDLKCLPKGKNAFIIGAGGAARAIGFALAKEKIRSIILYDIVMERAKKLANDISKIFPQCHISYIDSTIDYRLSTIDLLVNASTCGMKKTDPLPIGSRILPQGIAVYDIIYNPSPTRLVKVARAKGLPAINGLGMLLYQGALALEIWTGKRAPIDAMRRALLRALNK